MPNSIPSPDQAAQARQELLSLLGEGGRGAAGRQGERVRQLITLLERAMPADLAAPGALELLEGVWELRWSSSKQPYLAVGPWLENLQLLNPGDAPAGSPFQRVQVRFQRGGWLGPHLGGGRLQLLRAVQQPFPAWLDITVLDQELRVCRGNAGTLFALLRRPDLALSELLLPLTSAPGSESPADPGPA